MLVAERLNWNTLILSVYFMYENYSCSILVSVWLTILDLKWNLC